MEKIILVVEDEEELRFNICKILELLGIKTFEASNGKEGLDIINREKIDLIISDIKMPVMDGYEMLFEIKKDPEKSLIPFIFLTSNIEREQIRKGMNIGADDYITKPFNVDEIASSIKARFEKSGKLDDFYSEKFKLILDNMEEKYLKNPLSGLPNQDQLMKDINMHKVAYDETYIYFMFDVEIDGSKDILCFLSEKSMINLQKGIMEKIEKNIKDYSVLYHINDLEYVIYSKVKKMYTDIDNIELYANDLLTSIKEPFTSEFFNISITASAGISVIDENAEQFDGLLRNARSAKIYVQKNGGNGIRLHNTQLQQALNKKLSSDLALHIDMKSKLRVESHKHEIYETRIFFLYPQSIIQNQLIKEIVKNEYAAYVLNDHEKAFALLEKYQDSIIFINIDAVLKDEQWRQYIKNIQNNPRLVNIRTGILSHFNDQKKEEYYLMELLIPCGFIKMKSNFEESLKIILKVLDANEARGKRKYVRVRCDRMDNVSCSVKMNSVIYKGTIIDISSAGMAFILEGDATYFKENTEIDNIQLLLKGKICHLSGIIKGERQNKDKKIYVLLFGKMNHDELNKIHDFIFQALQDEITNELERL